MKEGAAHHHSLMTWTTTATTVHTSSEGKQLVYEAMTMEGACRLNGRQTTATCTPTTTATWLQNKEEDLKWVNSYCYSSSSLQSHYVKLLTFPHTFYGVQFRPFL